MKMTRLQRGTGPLVLLMNVVVLIGGIAAHSLAEAANSSAAPQLPSMNKTYNVPHTGGGVNLFTGDAEMALPLASISGRNGLHFTVLGNYSSNVMAEVGTDNAQAPTGALGLGWRFDSAKIVVDNKNTASREDDSFYLVRGTDKSLLVRTGSVGTAGAADQGYVYQSRAYTAWSIIFYPVNKRWEIIDENGMTSVFGNTDLDAGAHTIQWGVAHANWIGATKYGAATDGASRIPIVFNLARMVEPWGDALDFFYTPVERQIGGPNGLAYTRESYLTEVRNNAVFGDRIVLSYAAKANDTATNVEYLAPHALDPTYSYYQDRFETRYLDHVEVFKKNATAATSRTNLRYNFLEANKGAYAKRVLTEVQVVDANGRPTAPSTRYDYHTSVNDSNWGALKQVTSALGGATQYAYQEVSPALSLRDLPIARPDGYSKVRTWIGDGYVLVMWIQPSSADQADGKLLLQTYSWEGRWVPGNSTALPNTHLTDTVKVAIGPDLIGVLRSTGPCAAADCMQLTRLHKDLYRTGMWSASTMPLVGADGFTAANGDETAISATDISAGDGFIIVSGVVPGLQPAMKSLAWRWQGGSWGAALASQMPFPPGETNISGPGTGTMVRAGKNFAVTTTWCRDCRINFLRMRVHYFDEMGNLVSVAGNPADVAPLTMPFYDPNRLALEVGDGFAVLMGPKNPYFPDTSHGPVAAFITWQPDFSQFQLPQIMPLAEADLDYPIRIVGNTVGIGRSVFQLNRGQPVAVGIDSSTASTVTYTYGTDFAAGDASGDNSLFSYDPVQDSWVQNRPLYALGPVTAGQGTPGSGTLDFMRIGTDNLPRRARAVRYADGSWAIGTYGEAFSSREYVLALSGSKGLRSLSRSGDTPDSLYYSVVRVDALGEADPNSRQGGKFMLPDTSWRFGRSNDARGGNLLTADLTAIAYHANGGGLFEDADRLTLYRADSAYPYGFRGPQSVKVVSKIASLNGYGDVATAGVPDQMIQFVYNLDNATMDPTGRYARFNAVAVHDGAGIDGTDTAPLGQHYGISTTYFYNGVDPLVRSDLCADDSLPNWTDQCVALPNYPYLRPSNTDSYYGVLDGQAYYSAQWSEKIGDDGTWGRDKKLAESSSFLDVITRPLALNDQSIQVRPIMQVSFKDGVPTTTTQTYFDSSAGLLDGFLQSTSLTQTNANGQIETRTTTLQYAAQAYAGSWPLARHVLSPVAQVSTKRTDVIPPLTLAMTATTYQDWGTWLGKPGMWGPLHTYEWNHGAQSDVFDFSAPLNADWTRSGAPTRVNDVGLIEESRYYGGTPADTTIASVIFDKDKRFAVASFGGAAVAGADANASYWGMESYENDAGWSYDPNSASVVEGNANTGKRALRTGRPTAGGMGGMVSLNLSKQFHPINHGDDGVIKHYVLSAFVKMDQPGTPVKFAITAYDPLNTVLGSSARTYAPTDSATASQWQYVELYFHGTNITRIVPTISVTQPGVMIDDLRFAPAEATFGASVYDDDRGVQSATLGTNGEVNRVLLDTLDQPFAVKNFDGSVAGATIRYFSRNGNADTFNKQDPNAAISFIPTKKGLAEDFSGGALANWTCSNGSSIVSTGCALQNHALQLNSLSTPLVPGVTEAAWKLSPTSDYAVRFNLKPVVVPMVANAGFSVAVAGRAKLEYSNARWNLYERNASGNWTSVSSSVAPAPAALPLTLLLHVAGNRVLIYGDGKKIFDRAYGGVNTYPDNLKFRVYSPVAHTSRLGGITDNNVSTTVQFSAVTLVNAPLVNASFIDAGGRSLQTVLVNGNDAYVNGSLYQPSGARGVASKNAVYQGIALNYNPNFLKRDASGAVAGELLGFYDGSASHLALGYTNDGGFPFAASGERPESNSTMVSSGLPGAPYSEASPAAAGHLAIDDHARNSLPDSDPFKTASLGSFPAGQYLSASARSPSGAKTRSLSTSTGQGIADMQVGASVYGGTQDVQTLTDVDPQGRIANMYHPRYFAGSAEALSSKFKTTLAYSDHDQINSITTPNTGKVQVAYNKLGQLRYWLDAAGTHDPALGATQTDVLHYIKYDRDGRPVESGTWNKNFADLSTNEIEDVTLPAIRNVAATDPIWRKRLVFGVPVTNIDQNSMEKGRLIGVQTNTNLNSATSTSFDSMGFTHDVFGRVIEVTERTGSSAVTGVDMLTKYSYDETGALTAITYPAPIQPAQIAPNPWNPGAVTVCDPAHSPMVSTVINANAGYNMSTTDMMALYNDTAAVSSSTDWAQFMAVGSCASTRNGSTGVGAMAVQDLYTVTYGYNALGQLVRIGRVNGGVADDAYYARYTYGPNGELLNETLNNSNVGNTISTTMRYNAPGWLKQISSTTPNPAGGAALVRYQQSLRYDDANPGETPTYDGNISAMDQLIDLNGQHNPVTLNFNYTYYPEGGLQSATSTSGTLTDPDGYSWGMSNKDANGNPLKAWHRTGTLETFEDTINGTSPIILQTPLKISFNYVDGTDRLAGVNITNDVGWAFDGTRSYQYDANGNLTRMTANTNTGMRDSNSNMPPYSTQNWVTIHYDAFTNMADQITRNEHVDARYFGYSDISGTFNMTYGGIGDERISDRYQDGPTHQVTHTYFRGLGAYPLNIAREEQYVGSAAAVSRKNLVYGPSGLIAVCELAGLAGTQCQTDHFVLKNHLGSTVMVLRQDGALTESYTYTPTGTVFKSNGREVKEEQVVPYLYQRQQYDWQTGLHNFRARLYDSEILRFLAVDPAMSVSESPYISMGNDPVNMVDPNGRTAVKFGRSRGY